MTNLNTTKNPVTMIWSTPNGDQLLGYMARVSNPDAKPEDSAARLIKYLIKHAHWSPFEMVDACVQIECPRDISRQILRHRSFSFQEFSGRYAAYNNLLTEREGRWQDLENRQNSIPIADPGITSTWASIIQVVRDTSWRAYQRALDLGIAKEVARALLPEGLVPTRLYMKGSLRSWIHYWQVRCTPETQKEHREIAESTRQVILQFFPGVLAALEETTIG